ncbi:Hsp20/alpha crystallin family protein [Streptomyces sp. TLI_55]|uniref:Hsp20/alpha crystallin family protein n=1 Tax=Streptomyces sp. TLI_55 TaxID=1938861 RepID=UPI000BE28539|nr:Hsp20/alpha crystallin family protein [Streptomyces sp. TLI_55]
MGPGHRRRADEGRDGALNGRRERRSVEGGLLTPRAERTAEPTDRHRTEFRHGTFARCVRLPAGAKGDMTTAAYQDGVLTITVPVPRAKSGTTTIPVRHGG